MCLWSFSKRAFIHVLLAMEHILQVNHMLKFCANEEGHGYLLIDLLNFFLSIGTCSIVT